MIASGMKRSKLRELAGKRVLFARRVFLRVQSWWATPAVILALLGYWRDEGPGQLQPPLISTVVELLPWWGWIAIATTMLMLIVLEGSYRLVAQTDPSLLVRDYGHQIPVEEMGLLDYVPEHLRAIKLFTRQLNQLTAKQSAGTRMISRYGSRFQATDDVHRRQRMAGDVAKIIEGQNDELRSALPVLGEQSSRFMATMQRWLESSVIETETDRGALLGLRDSTQLFLDNLRSSISAVGVWHEATRSLRQRNASAGINRACDNMDGLLNEYIAMFKGIETSEVATIARMDALLKDAQESRAATPALSD